MIEVEDWEGVAGILEINTYSIREECARSLTVFRCQWRNVVQEICYKQAVNNPRQIVCDIANVLEHFITPPRIRQANLLRDIHFGEFGHVFTCMLQASTPRSRANCLSYKKKGCNLKGKCI